MSLPSSAEQSSNGSVNRGGSRPLRGVGVGQLLPVLEAVSIPVLVAVAEVILAARMFFPCPGEVLVGPMYILRVDT